MTDRGWGVLGAGIAAIALWILLGEVELLVTGSVLVAAVVLAIGLTRLNTPRVGVVRQLMPALVNEGETAEVRAELTNEGRRPLHNVVVSDVVGALGSAEFAVGRIRPGETALATYRIVCRPRGVYQVGPAGIEVSDPARLAVRAGLSSGADRLVVYPRTEELSGFPLARGLDPTTQASKPEFANRGGEEFYTLREYVEGDDLRFIHWPSSAKRDQLLIRQLETPWQQRALLFLDLRRSVYHGSAAFEHAVRGAASLVVHLRNGGYDSLVWAGGIEAIPSHHIGAVMEKLAMATVEDHLDIRALAGRVRQRGGGGALLMVTGTPDVEAAEVTRLLGQDYGTTVVLCATDTTSPVTGSMHRSGVITIQSSPGESWARAWVKAVGMSWPESQAL